MASNFLASDFNNWISRINAVRTKSGIGLSALTDSVSQGSVAQASKMSSLKSSILGMKTNTYLSYADYSSIENQNIVSGSQILQTQKNQVETVIASLEKICPNNLTTTTTNDYKTNYTTDDSYNGTCSTYTTCKTNSKETIPNHNSTQSTRMVGYDDTQTVSPSNSTENTWNYSCSYKSCGTGNSTWSYTSDKTDKTSTHSISDKTIWDKTMSNQGSSNSTNTVTTGDSTNTRNNVCAVDSNRSTDSTDSTNKTCNTCNTTTNNTYAVVA